LYTFHGQFGVTDLEGNPMKKAWMIATNMEELSEVYRNMFVMVLALMVKAGVLH